MKKVFISYKRQDKQQVLPIVERIKIETGIDCWIDLDGIESGDQFQNIIIDAIDNADIVLIMLSNNFIAPYREENTGRVNHKKQTFPEKEVMYALHHNKRLVPISIDGTSVYNCKWLEFNCSGLDCIDWNDESHRVKLFRNLINWSRNPQEELSHNNLNSQNQVSTLASHRIKKPIALKEISFSIAEFLSSFNFHTNRRVKRSNNRRQISTGWLIAIVIGITVFLCGSLISLFSRKISNLLHNDSSSQPIDSVSLEPNIHRACICAADGSILAQDVDVYDLYLELQKYDSIKESSELNAITNALSLVDPTNSSQEWLDVIQSAINTGEERIRLFEGLSTEDLNAFRIHGFVLEGASSEESSTIFINAGGHYIGTLKHRYLREYPYGDLAKSTIGYVEKDRNIKVGLEGKYYNFLSHQPNNRQENLHTTLDITMQAAADNTLRSNIDSTIIGACLLVMEVKTGAIRAMVNLHRAPDGHFGEYYNYAIGHTYEPGTVASTMTLAIVLQDKIYTSLDQTIPTNSGYIGTMPCDFGIREYEDSTGEREIPIINGFKISPRFVATSLVRKSNKNYIEELKDLTSFENVDGFDIDGFMDVYFPSPNIVYEEDLLSIASGFSWQLTPLHLLVFYNMVANNGKKMMPYIVDTNGPVQLNGSLEADVAFELKRVLKDQYDKKDTSQCQVAGISGISRQILYKVLRYNGQAYTGADDSNIYSSTFAGYFPADNPEYSVVCVVFTDLIRYHYSPILFAPEIVIQNLVDVAINNSCLNGMDSVYNDN